MSLGWFILRADKKNDTAQFYRKLGLVLTSHHHDGPTHFLMAPVSRDIVFEIYQTSKKHNRDAIMLNVDNLEKVLELLGLVQSEIHESNSIRFTYVSDPDGRDVILIQKK